MVVPLDIHGMPSRSFVLEGSAPTDGGTNRALMNIVTPEYFRTMGIRMLAGSDFAEMSRPPDRPEVIVNEAFIDRYMDGNEPVGRGIETSDRDAVIVGVVADSVYNRFDEPGTPIMCRSFATTPRAWAHLHVRTRPGVEIRLGQDIGIIVREIEPALPLFDLRTMAQHVDTNLFITRIPARMFTVARRTREIGIRLALGAERRAVVAQIVMQTMSVVLFGAMAGWMMAFVPQIHLAPGQPLDRLAFFGVPVLLLTVAAVASWLPARRAARIDPMESLRDE
jgi:hypothetical protein